MAPISSWVLFSVLYIAGGNALSFPCGPCQCNQLDGLTVRVEVDCNNLLLDAVPSLNVSYEHITTLLLSANRITVLTQLPTMPNLRLLVLTNNGLTFIEGGLLSQATPSLQQLHLSNNDLIAVSGDTFAGLAILRELYLDFNRISSLHSASFLGLRELARLNIDSNPLLGLPPGLFDDLVSIRYISIMDGLIRTIPPGLFGSCQQLTHLFLGKQFLVELTAQQSRGLERLQVLMLNFNRFESLSIDLIASFPQLMVLGLRGNLITRLETQGLRHGSLLRLWLRSNQLSRIPPRSFDGLTKLVELEMDGNPSECKIIDGEAVCLCSASNTGPVRASYASGMLFTRGYCIPDACLAHSISNATLSQCGPQGCWTNNNTVYSSNVCRCVARRVDCDGIGLTTLPPNIPSDTRQLAMFMNDLTSFPSLKHLPQLYMTDFRANKIAFYPPAADVLPDGFRPLSTSLDFNYSQYLNTSKDHALISTNVAGSTHTFIPSSLLGTVSVAPASFTGRFAFGGLGTIGNPSKCTLDERNDNSLQFNCISCALGYINQGDRCVPPPLPALSMYRISSELLAHNRNVTLTLTFSTIVRSIQEGHEGLALDDFSFAGHAAHLTDCTCVDDLDVTVCEIMVTPVQQEVDSTFYVIVGTSSYHNVARMANPAAAIVELRIDTRPPLVMLDIHVEDELARSGHAPFELRMDFDESVETPSSWLSAIVTNSTELTLEVVEVSGNAVRFMAQWSGARARPTVIAVDVNNTLIVDQAGNRLQPSGSLTLHFSPTCLEEPSSLADQADWLREPRLCALPSSSSRSKRALYFGIPAAIIILLIGSILAVIRYRSLHKPAFDFRALMEEVREQHLAHLFGTPEFGSGASQGSMESQLPALRAPLEVSQHSLTLGESIGEGFFGSVVKGTVTLADTTVDVAIKTVKDVAKTRSLLEEAVIMAQLDHPNLVRLIGVHTSTVPSMLILEFCHNGSLDHFLKAHAKGVAKLTHAQQLNIIVDVLEGMNYLESLKLIHRDLAARNVLLTADYECRIADLGMARFGQENDDYYIAAKSAQVPVRWMAPESLNHNKYSSQSDVWSFGILLVEIWQHGDTPYNGWSSFRVMQEVSGGYKHPRPTGCPHRIYETMLSTWSQDKWQRPTFKQLLRLFHGMLQDELQANDQIHSLRQASSLSSIP